MVGKGAAGAVPYFALQMQDAAHLAAYPQVSCTKAEDFASPLLADGAFAVTDPDGRRVVFGLPRANLKRRTACRRACSTSSARRSACPRCSSSTAASAWSNPTACWKETTLSAVFLRSDPEHHSFAAFRAPESRPDHHCYETNGWLDIRDWADRMAKLRIPLWWGPGATGRATTSSS